MALAFLGFEGGPHIYFRLNPSSIDWGFDIHTNVVPTVGGRVVQVTGATLRDLVVTGYLGENRDAGRKAWAEGEDDGLIDHMGASWRLHEDFVRKCRKIMETQAEDATQQGRMYAPALFRYPPERWEWEVYLKRVEDLDGAASIEHRTGKFSHGYRLTLFIVQTGSSGLTKAGMSGGKLDEAKATAIKSYIDRISEGIGWKQTAYNGGADAA